MTSTRTLQELLRRGPAAIDGGLASELGARGHDLSGDLWSARLLRDDPAAIRDVHTTYFLTGATVGISASYQASRSGFVRAGLTAADADRLLTLSVQLVREARAVAAGEGVHHPMLVAASVGPYGATLHDGSEYRGRYGVDFEKLLDFHRERLDVLVAARPDLLAIETIPDLDESRAILEALRDFDVPAWMSFSCADAETTCAGQPIEEAAELVSEAGLAAIGVNCTKPEHVAGLVSRIRSTAPTLPIVVYPNAGRVWDGVRSVWLGDGSDVLPEAAVASWFDAGVSLVGGCCGLGPQAITSVVDVAARV
ncbi:MAG TPA: homocysteine S-methyltransferase [Candidatus Nanopelagicales bacterium]|nr:homocysteine S-methyltransferase [Candidatus Nanopelagicales bacterium]